MRAGVVGHPVAHSLSPLIHGVWIGALGLDATFERFDVAPQDFEAFVDRHRRGSLAGVNVTIPHKEVALRIADVVDAAAAGAGAANLLLFRPDGRVEARNTDGVGLLEAFRVQAPGFDVTAGPVLVIGAGGAARGAVAALIGAGAQDIRISNRTKSRAQALADAFDGRVRVSDSADGIAAVINATSLGLNGAGEVTIDWTRARPDAVAMDMVYKPLRTGFLAGARAAGRRTVDGLEMLIRQAMPSFEAFFGVAPPDIDVRTLALEALGERS